MLNKELYHYGVKGMRWGVRRYRNTSGQLTEKGRKRLSEDIRKQHIQDFGGSTYSVIKSRGKKSKRRDAIDEEVNNAHSSKALSSARKKLLEADKLSADFYSNSDLVRTYQVKAAKAAAKRWNLDEDDMIDFYVYEDGDQGDGNSFQTYLKDKKIDVKSYAKTLYSARKEYENECRNFTNELLREHGNTAVKSPYCREQTVSDVFVGKLVSRADDEQMRHNQYGYWNI